MAFKTSSPSRNALTMTKPKLFGVVSLALTWWLATLLPHYQPMIKTQFMSKLDALREKVPAIIKVDWNVSPNNYNDPRNAYNRSKLVLLIDPQPLPLLPPLIVHMISVVPPDWRFLFIGSEKSVASVGRSSTIKFQLLMGKIDLLVMPEPWSIEGKEHIHRMLTDVRFYDEFLPEVEWLLKFEADSILCSNSEVSLNDWLEWDWTGAPRSLDDGFSGYGGLTLRRISAVKRILSFQSRFNESEPEDEWFGSRLHVMPGMKVASGLSGALAVEDVYFPDSMGFHVRDRGSDLKDEMWKNKDQRRAILDYCPELSMIMEMKLERQRCDGDDREGTIVEETNTARKRDAVMIRGV